MKWTTEEKWNIETCSTSEIPTSSSNRASTTLNSKSINIFNPSNQIIKLQMNVCRFIMCFVGCGFGYIYSDFISCIHFHVALDSNKKISRLVQKEQPCHSLEINWYYMKLIFYSSGSGTKLHPKLYIYVNW